MNAAEFDVVIVGAGVSGAWCAWRLAQTPAGSRSGRIGLFEQSDRVGGRLLSVSLPGTDVVCELGGMRYMSTQRRVRWLVEDELKLTHIKLPSDQPDNIAYLRGCRLRRKDLTDAPIPQLVSSGKIPYRLREDECKNPSDLLARAIREMAPDAEGKFEDELRAAVRKATYKGRPLWWQGFWNILARTMSNEAYLYTKEAGGYDTTQLNWNAADTVVLNADFREGVTFWRIKEGFDAVPRQLVGRFENSKHGQLYLQHRLRTLSEATLDDGTRGIVLTFDDVKHNTLEVRARSVILAMPRRSLELLDDSGPVLGDSAFQSLLKTVTPIPLFKCFVAYDRPWWDEVSHVSSGRSVTDLPLRQVYYWSFSPGEPSVLLATYDDTLNVSFWRGLAADKARYDLKLDHVADVRMQDSIRASMAPRVMSPRVYGNEWDVWKAPSALVDEVHRQLIEMHIDERTEMSKLTHVRPPYAAVYRDWSEDPFGGGVNFWNIGKKSWEVGPKMAHPVSGIPVYVCGEAYSDSQGWVEGALQTAELVCTEHLGLQPISFPKR